MGKSKKQQRLWDAYASPVFVHNQPCEALEGIEMRAWLVSCGAQKNSVWLLRTCADGLLRLAYPSGARPCVRRPTRVSGIRGAAYSVQTLRRCEARTARLARRQSVLHQALCPLRGTALPFGHDQGHCHGIAAGLGHRQVAGKAIYGGTTGQGGRTGAIGIGRISIKKGHTYRIVVSDLIRGRPIWLGDTDRSE